VFTFVAAETPSSELAGELLAPRIDARERLADPLLLLGDLEPVKSPAEPMGLMRADEEVTLNVSSGSPT
jgi:hypothetical protein